jgi:nitrogen fixation protein NifU and related proteins
VSTDDYPLPGQVGESFFRLAREPRNIGSLESPHGKGSAVGECGDSIEVSLRVDRGAITDIRVLPQGCVYTLVCASAMSELARGKDLDRALEIEPQDLVTLIGGLPSDHMHCARLAVNTLGEAIADYYSKVLPSGKNGQGSSTQRVS